MVKRERRGNFDDDEKCFSVPGSRSRDVLAPLDALACLLETLTHLRRRLSPDRNGADIAVAACLAAETA